MSASASADPRRHGKVERYDPARRFGFIQCDNYDRLFFHRGAILNADTTTWTPVAGDRVVFDRGVGPRGPRAVHVQPDDDR